jgi:protein TonB
MSAPSAVGSLEEDAGPTLVALIQKTIEAALVYPPLARKRGLQGTVLAGFRVDGEGRPLDIRVLRSSGHGVLDRAVVRTIRRAWPYPPVADAIEVPVRFRLVAGEPPER